MRCVIKNCVKKPTMIFCTPCQKKWVTEQIMCCVDHFDDVLDDNYNLDQCVMVKKLLLVKKDD